MNPILIYFFMGISLSVDAFFLSLSLGMNILTEKKKTLLPILIGIMHFLMPQMGTKIGSFFIKYLTINSNIISSLIFFLLAIEMIWNEKKEQQPLSIHLETLLLLAFAVSIDSLSVGIAFGLNKENSILPSSLFMFESYCFTKLGFLLGRKLKEKHQKIGTIIGISIMILISIKYLIFP